MEKQTAKTRMAIDDRFNVFLNASWHSFENGLAPKSQGQRHAESICLPAAAKWMTGVSFAGALIWANRTSRAKVRPCWHIY
jgi:hypothetical protein